MLETESEWEEDDEDENTSVLFNEDEIRKLKIIASLFDDDMLELMHRVSV